MKQEKYILKPDLNKARKRTHELTEELHFALEDSLKNIGKGKKYNVQTYGCQGNEADSEMICGILESIGYEKTDTDHADVVILNTCAIRENAENRIWGELGRLKSLLQNHKDLVIGLCGCMPQEEVVINRILEKYPHINLVFGTHNIFRLPYLLQEHYNSGKKVIEVFSEQGAIVEDIPKNRESSHKAWVNIMFGCDEFCTYCIVPYTRGKERSRSPKSIIQEVEGLVKDGYKEVTLLGQNVNAYGKDFTWMDYTFGDLLRDLDKTGIQRIRYTTSHPRDLDEKTIFAMRDCPSVMPSLHLPVQSGNNTVLKRMNRKYTKEHYIELIDSLKKNIPGISITTDIIVGFPGETEEQFQDTLDLVDYVQYEGAYTFIFSPREGTPAARMEDATTAEEKHQRLQRLNEKVNSYYLQGNQRFLNTEVEVLVDGLSKSDANMVCGYTKHNKLINFNGDASLIGKMVMVKVTDAKTWFLMGEFVRECD